MWIDSHAHLCAGDFEGDLDKILSSSREVNIEKIINICTNPEELKKGLRLSKQYPWIYNAGATTPHDAETEGDLYFEEFASHARAGDLIAIGETGLDYHYYLESASMQQNLLRRYFRLALECDLPIIIHCREAFSDFFRILDEEYSGRGVLHCFTGTWEEAQELIARGWYLSFSGIVTFKKSQALQQIVGQIPLKHLILETDAPFLAPLRYRGKRNEPAYLIETARFIAEVRGMKLEELALASTQNVHDLFQCI